MAPPPPPIDKGGPTTSSASANAENAVPAGAFGKRFPRITATFQKYSSTRAGRMTAMAWTRRRPILIGIGLTYGILSYAVLKRDAYIRDIIHPDSWIVLKVYPGSIVEAKQNPGLAALLSSPSAGEDLPPKVMDLFEVCRALKWATRDERIKGIFADFGGLHIPTSVSSEALGMAQLEELVEAIHEFKLGKKQQYYLKQAVPEEELLAITEGGEMSSEKAEATAKEISEKLEKAEKDSPPPPTTTIAWADSFDSQGSYLLASAFDQVYLQPSGEVPLTGVAMQIPFVKRALDWIGIKVYAEARREFKSMISTFTESEGLPPAQLQDEARLLGELSRGLAHAIGVNRFPEMDPEKAADRVTELTKRGPFSAKDAVKEGLITGIKYKSEVLKELGEEPKLKSLASYSRITDQALDRKLSDDERSNVAVIYLRGTISNAPGDFTASSVIKGLREAGEDDDISSIVLRIDSGGGDVVASDSIWDAVRRVQENHKKPVVASFGNASASGGYYASAGADAIVACESTITGSIGVASLRPTITKKVFDRVGVTLQTLFTGSKMNSSIHELTAEEKERQSLHIDETYESFIEKVCTGRKISKDVIEELAGGRVWTGLAAWVRCNPEKETTKDDIASTSVSKGMEEKMKLKDWKAETSKAVNMASDWKTTDVTRDGEMSTYRIQAVFATPTSSGKTSSASPEKGSDVDEEALTKQILAEFASEEESNKTVKGLVGRGIAAHSVNEEIDIVDEDGRLASEAHAAAEASMGGKAKPGEETIKEGEEEIVLGPYGRGLIDSIGGIWDASYLAMSLALQREIDELVKGGKTMEQAMNSIRPGCQREIGPDGTVSIATDLRLIKYPKEKNWREKWRDMQKIEERPSLSLLPGLGNVGLQLRDFVSSVALQVLMRSWRDPAMIQQMISEVEKERGMKMEYHSSMRM
ncbi:hypothetical protein CBS101457_001394 [Exobasidium rhododendri]|nr:hypothetical protein CBS101457_001394 [Exobasidium rhododendri]